MFTVGFIFGIYWNFSAPQNIFAAGCLLGVLCIICLWKQRTIRLPIVAFTAVFIIAVIIGALQGGMLTPKKLRTQTIIPGAADVYLPGKYTGIKPELPYAVGFDYTWQYGTPYDPAEKQMYVDILRGGAGLHSGQIIYQIIWRLESNFWAALRVMFFPLLGLVAWYFLRKKSLGPLQEKSGAIELFWQYSHWVFLACFLLTFTVMVSGRKWEMSRFMMDAYALGLIVFILAFFTFLLKIPSKTKQRWLMLVVAFVMTVGPLVNGLAIIHKNLSGPQRQKFSVFFSNPGIVGKEWWDAALKKSEDNAPITP